MSIQWTNSFIMHPLLMRLKFLIRVGKQISVLRIYHPRAYNKTAPHF